MCKVLGKPGSHPRGPGFSPELAQSGGLLMPRIRRARAPHGMLDNSGVWVVLTWSPGSPHSAPAAGLSSGWREGPAQLSDGGVWLSGSQAQAAHREPSTDPQTLLALCSVGQAPQTRAGKADPGAGDLASSPAAPLPNPLLQVGPLPELQLQKHTADVRLAGYRGLSDYVCVELICGTGHYCTA